MAENTKPVIPTNQVEIMKMSRPARNAGRLRKTPGHGILRAEPGLVGRTRDRPEPAPAGPVLHRAIPGAARGRRADVRTGPVRLVADRRWARRHAAGLLVGGAARVA